MLFRCLFCLVVFAPLLLRSESRFTPEGLAHVRQELQAMVDRQEFAGINAVLFQKSDVVLAESFGFGDMETRQPMQADSIFWVASLTKPVTAVAVMMLYDEGKFDLDDPVAKYLPAFANTKVLAKETGSQTEVVDVTQPMTIRHLLTHTSGLFNNAGYSAAHVFPSKVSLQEMATRLATIPLSHQPGQAWRYGASFEVLAALVEVWSGQSYDDFLSQRLFQPLGMKDTGFYVPVEKQDRVTRRYLLNEQKQLVLQPGQIVSDKRPVFFSGGAGLYSTSGDYLRFCRMLMNGGSWEGRQLLKPATIDLMFKNHVAANVLPPDGPNGRVGYGQGLGFYVLLDPSAGKSVCPVGEVNATGMAATFLWIDRKNELIGLLFMQRPPQSQTTLNQFKALVYGEMKP